MIKAGIDQDALVTLFSQAGARQGEVVRKAVFEATLKALQGRELTLENIRRVLKAATLASSNGAASNHGSREEVETLLGKAIAGMDAALIKAVQANRTALQQFMDLGVGLQDEHMKTALGNLARMEEVFIAAVGKVAEVAAAPLVAPWHHVIEHMKHHGTSSGMQANEVVQQLMDQSHTALRSGRAASVRAAQSMMENYASLVSGVLLGMSDGMGKAASEGHAEKRATRK
jgi:hypothetical protein